MSYNLGTEVIPVVATLPSGVKGQQVLLSTDNKLYVHNGTNFVRQGQATSRFERSFVIPGVVAPSVALPGFFLPVAAGTTTALIGVRHVVLSGTSQAFRVRKNTADITGFGTSGTPLSATTTATYTDPTDVAATDGDYYNIILGTGSGTPTDLTISLIFESVN